MYEIVHFRVCLGNLINRDALTRMCHLVDAALLPQIFPGYAVQYKPRLWFWSVNWPILWRYRLLLSLVKVDVKDIRRKFSFSGYRSVLFCKVSWSMLCVGESICSSVYCALCGKQCSVCVCVKLFNALPESWLVSARAYDLIPPPYLTSMTSSPSLCLSVSGFPPSPRGRHRILTTEEKRTDQCAHTRTSSIIQGAVFTREYLREERGNLCPGTLACVCLGKMLEVVV